MVNKLIMICIDALRADILFNRQEFCNRYQIKSQIVTPNLDWLLRSKRPENFNGSQYGSMHSGLNSIEEILSRYAYPKRLYAFSDSAYGRFRIQMPQFLLCDSFK